MSPMDPSPERLALADSFLALGPEAPTILPGWDAPDLLEHLLVRERSPHLTVGSRLPGPLGARAESALERLRDTGWEELVERLREGPGRLSPIGRLDRFIGEGELLIHHEDLRRAQEDWEPRRLTPATDAQAWRALALTSRVSLKVPTDITFVSPLGGLRRTSRGADGSLRVHGDALELLLWASGRDDVARVQVHGDEHALQALRTGRRGL